jgi:hypothetical protein
VKEVIIKTTVEKADILIFMLLTALENDTDEPDLIREIRGEIKEARDKSTSPE